MAPRDFSEDGAFGASTNADGGANPAASDPFASFFNNAVDPMTGSNYDFQAWGQSLAPGQSSRQGNRVFTNRSNTGAKGPFGETLQAKSWDPSTSGPGMGFGAIMHEQGGPVMGYAEGGAIEDDEAQPDRLPSYSEDPGEEPTSEPEQRDPSKFMGDVAEAGKQTPLEGVKQFPGNVKRIVSYLMGEGADHPQALDQAGAQVDPQGQMPPDDRNLLAVQKAAEAGGQEAAWKLVQANRVAYNAKQSFGYAAINGTQQKPPDLNAAVDAANKAASHVLDGSKVQFAPAQGGVTATVTSPGAAQPQTYNLSLDAFRKYLNVGGDGQWDRLMQTTIPQTLAKLSQGQGAGISRLDQMKPRPNARPQAAPGAIDTSEPQPQEAPVSDAVRTGKPQAMDVTQGDQPALPGTHDKRGRYLGIKAPDKLNYGEELEARSQAMFPGSSQEQQRQAWMAAQEQQGLERENKLGIAEETGKRRVEAARETGASRVQAADVAGTHKTEGWKYASDAKKATAQIAADQRAAHDGNVDARARVESARKTIATKRMTAGTLSPEDEALEKALTAQGQVANQRPGQQQAAPQQSSPPPAAQRQVGHTVTTSKGTFKWNGKGWDPQ